MYVDQAPFTCARCPAVTSALDAVPEAYDNPAAVWWGAFCCFCGHRGQVVIVKPVCWSPQLTAPAVGSPSLEGVWRTVVSAAELETLMLLNSRSCTLLTVVNGPAISRHAVGLVWPNRRLEHRRRGLPVGCMSVGELYAVLSGIDRGFQGLAAAPGSQRTRSRLGGCRSPGRPPHGSLTNPMLGSMPVPAISGSSPLSITEFPRLGSACRH